MHDHRHDILESPIANARDGVRNDTPDDVDASHGFKLNSDRPHASNDGDLHNLDLEANGQGHSSDALSHTLVALGDSTPGTSSSGFDDPGDYELGSNRMEAEEARYRYFYLPAYAALFLVIIATLEILRFVSERQHGLADASRDNHYLWAYGPTLFLTILAGFWGQFEYRTKQMIPWAAMSCRPLPADKTILLDYTSAFIAKALVESVRAMHVPVTAGILGTLLLRALIITSTGLLGLRSWKHPEQINLRLRNEFNFTIVNDLYSLKGPVDPASMVWVINDRNVPYPVGTNSEMAAQTYMHPVQMRDRTIYADTDVFSAELRSCEPFHWRYSNPDHHYNANNYDHELGIDVWTSSCFIKSFTFDWLNKNRKWIWPGSEIAGVKCSNVTDEQNPFRILISFSPAGWQDGSPESFSGIICDPIYSLTKRTVTSLSSGIDTNYSVIISNETKQTLPINIDMAGFNNELSWTFYYGLAITGANPLHGFSPWFSLLNQSLPQEEPTDFRDAGILAEASRRVFRTGVSQWVNLAHLSPTEKNISGTAISSRDRLFVVLLPLRLMEAFLILLAVACIITSITWPVETGRRDAGPLMTNAVMLSQSPGLQKLLRHAGSLCAEGLRQSLDDFTFTICNRLNFQHCFISVQPRPSPSDTWTGNDAKWWKPTASSPVFRTMAVIVPISIVAILETMLQLSRRNGGLATVDDSGPERYAWLYGPTVTMTLIGMSFTVLGSAAIALHPFQALRRGNCNVHVLTEDPANKPVLLAAIKSLSDGYPSLGLMLAAALVSSNLTIAASGLYSTRYILRTEPATLSTVDWFNVTNSSAHGIAGRDKYDGMTAGLVQYYNLSFPQWTYDELAFPRLQGHDLEKGNLSLSAIVPAVRAQMNCSAQFYQHYSAYFDPLPGCDPKLSNGSLANLTIGPTFNSQIKAVGGVDYFATVAYETSDPLMTRCPRSYRWWALGWKPGMSFAYQNVMLLFCQPYVEQVLVNTTFKLPGYVTDKRNPPQPDESTAKFLSNDPVALQPSINPEYVLGYEDALFQAVVWGFEGTAIEELLGEANARRALEKAEHTYRQIIAQNLNEYFRVLGAEAAHRGSFNATIADGSQLRLVQNAVSTRILEGLLLFMTLCAGVSFFLERSTRILPKNPASIASAMSLFADSDLLQILAREAATLNGKKGLQDGPLKEYRYRLGWWDKGTERERFGIDIEPPRGIGQHEDGEGDAGSSQLGTDPAPQDDRPLQAEDGHAEGDVGAVDGISNADPDGAGSGEVLEEDSAAVGRSGVEEHVV